MKKEIRKYALQIVPSHYLHYRDYLLNMYRHLKKSVAEYSYYKMAEDLGFNPSGIIHQFIKGKRKLSIATANRIAASIGLRGDERLYFLSLVKYNGAKTKEEREQCLDDMLRLKRRNAPAALAQEQTEYSSEWYHTVIREMVAMPNFRPDPAWIASSLVPQIKPSQARKSLDLLVSLGLIRFDETLNRMVQTAKTVQTPQEVTLQTVAKFHHHVIDLAHSAISSVDQNKRDISGITLRISERTLLELKERIYQFLRSALESEVEAEESRFIYQLSIQFFPVTQRLDAIGKETDHG